jgi:hypothetical protein
MTSPDDYLEAILVARILQFAAGTISHCNNVRARIGGERCDLQNAQVHINRIHEMIAKAGMTTDGPPDAPFKMTGTQARTFLILVAEEMKRILEYA